jgi:hypothetical protein
MTLLSNRTPKLLHGPLRHGNNVWVRGTLVAVVVATVVLAGCGSSSRDTDAGTVSVGAYGVFPARTAKTTKASAVVCRTNAETLVDDAHGFLAHFGRVGAYPADLNYVIVRDDLARFRSHGCEPAVLGRALSQGLTAAQRSELVANLPTSMAQALRSALADT